MVIHPQAKSGAFYTGAAKGEDSHLQFKQDILNADALASEMVAFSNSEGGRILIGVTDAGKLEGVPRADVGRMNQIISNLTVEKIRTGNPIIRNPILVSYVAKCLLALPRARFRH